MRSFVLAFMLLFPTVVLWAGAPQNQGPPVQFGGAIQPGVRQQQEDPALIEARRKQQKAENAKRQKSLQDDTNQLLKLAQELKASVDKSDKNTLSLEVLRKASQIEELAKQVQKKMRADEYMPLVGDQQQTP